MGKNTNKETEVLSKSKEKRIERQKEVAKEKKVKLARKIVWTLVAVVVVAFFAVAIGLNIYKAASRTKSNSDFSAGLTKEGFIEGVDVNTALSLVDFENMIIPLDEVKATDEEVQKEIDAVLTSNQELSDSQTAVISDGDKVSIDYVGTIDGVAFEGGDSNGQGADLTIGSGQFIPGFEEQLTGHHPGEEVVVNVTFPEDYQEADLAGKDASFAVTIHGIYVTPEFNDEFVKAHLSEEASTAEEYRGQIEKKFYDEHVNEYIAKYIIEQSEVLNYPKSFVKKVKGVIKYNDENMLSYYNQMFQGYGVNYQNVWETREGIEDEASYEKELTQRAEESVKESLVYQAIFEKAGLAVDMDSYYEEMLKTSGEENVNNVKETYGEGYLAQSQMKETVTKYLFENAKVQ